MYIYIDNWVKHAICWWCMLLIFRECCFNAFEVLDHQHNYMNTKYYQACKAADKSIWFEGMGNVKEVRTVKISLYLFLCTIKRKPIFNLP